jgi:MHS family proline/betaine transporter-like MFS transporter
MAISTTAIGMLPSYQTIGIMAPICLIMCRVVQGISMGGNYGGSITYIFENGANNKKGFTASFSVISILIGLFLASLTIALFDNIFDNAFIYKIGFRIPFLLGLFVCVWTYVLHKTLDESPDFQMQKNGITKNAHPVKTLFSLHQTDLAKITGIVVLHDLSFYILFVYMMTYFTETLGFSKHIIFGINSFSLVLVAAAVLISAWFSDKIGRKPIMIYAAAFFVLATIPIMSLLTPQCHWSLIMLGHCILAIAVGAFLGPLPALMVETFPESIRNTGITTTGNISGPIFGGSAPLVMTYLTQVTGLRLIPAFYLTASAIIALVALLYLKIRKH